MALHTEAIELEPFDSSDVGDHANRVREDFGLRQHPLNRTLGEGSVTDFPATWSTNRLALTDRVGREVVVEHERFGEFVEQSVRLLLIADGAQNDGTRRLSFATGKHSRTMHAGQNLHLAIDCSQSGRCTTVETLASEGQVTAGLMIDCGNGFLQLVNVRPSASSAIPSGKYFSTRLCLTAWAAAERSFFFGLKRASHRLWYASDLT